MISDEYLGKLIVNASDLGATDVAEALRELQSLRAALAQPQEGGE